MNAARTSGRVGQLARWVAGSTGSGALAVLLLVGAGAIAAWYAWRQWGGEILQQSDYAVTADQIVITPPPPWIHSDVKAEVIRSGSLDKLQLLDPDLALQIQQAFALHAWVADVRRVRKQFPPRIQVDLEYRRPVAMVTAASGGYWPIDTQGVLLPPEEFSPEQTRHFLRVVVSNSQPNGPVGTPYGDHRIVGAARIADLLHPHREPLGLEHLVVGADTGSSQGESEPVYELFTVGRTRVIWGRAPGREGPGEVTASEKVARLLALVQQHGPLDAEGSPQEIDLRDTAGIGVVPRTADRRQEELR